MKNAIHYVGLDVYKETIAVAMCDQEGRATSLGTIPYGPDPVARLMRRLQQKATLRICYEAGCCGYVLQRQLTAMGIDCIVVAPSLIPVKSGDRVKTDRRDALKLARYLRAGELTAVWVPDESHEALRDLVRQREDAKADQKRARNRLGKFLLRQGWCPPEGIKVASSNCSRSRITTRSTSTRAARANTRRCGQGWTSTARATPATTPTLVSQSRHRRTRRCKPEIFS